MQGCLLVVSFRAKNCKVKLPISGQLIASEACEEIMCCCSYSTAWALRFVTAIEHGSFCSSKCIQFTITCVSFH